MRSISSITFTRTASQQECKLYSTHEDAKQSTGETRYRCICKGVKPARVPNAAAHVKQATESSSGYLGNFNHIMTDLHRPFVFHHFLILNILEFSYDWVLWGVAMPYRWVIFQTRNQKYNMNTAITIINPGNSLKTFVFERQDTQQSVIVEQQIDLRYSFSDLSHLFNLYCPLTHNKVSIYDPKMLDFVSLAKVGSENGRIPKSFLEPTFILIRYISKGEQTAESDSLDSSNQNERGFLKQGYRRKERTIGQSIELVKKWRDLHNYGDKNHKKRLNLQDAAKIVGVSKKSLDDYYCQLRLGELYNFKFSENLDEKMGVLRTYVKNYRPERQGNKKQNEKHPKNLRVINQFDLQTKKLREVIFGMEQRDSQNNQIPFFGSNAQEQNQNPLIEQKQSPFQDRDKSEPTPIVQELCSLEHQFFKCFDLALGHGSDLYFDLDRDFRKKDFALDSDSFLLFE